MYNLKTWVPSLPACFEFSLVMYPSWVHFIETLHPALLVRGGNLLKFFLSPSFCKLPTGVYFVPCCYLVTFWMAEKHLAQNGLVYSHFKTNPSQNQSCSFYVIQHKKTECPSCSWNGFCTDFCHYQIIFFIWFFVGLLFLACLALLYPPSFCYCLSQCLSLQFSQILINIVCSEIFCHLEQRPCFNQQTKHPAGLVFLKKTFQNFHGIKGNI